MTSRASGITALTTLFLLSGNIRAATIQVNFTGHLTDVFAPLNPSQPGQTPQPDTGGFFTVNSPVSYQLVFNETPASTGLSAESYYYSIVSFSGTVGSYAFAGTSGTVTIANNKSHFFDPSHAFDSLAVEHANSAFQSNPALNRSDFVSDSGPIGTSSIMSVAFDVGGPTSFLDSTDLTIAPFQHADFLSLSRCGVLFQDFAAFGQFDTISATQISSVPLPASFWLFGWSLMGLAGIRGRVISSR